MHAKDPLAAPRHIGLLVLSTGDWGTQAVEAARRLAERRPGLVITPLRADYHGIDYIPLFDLRLDGLVSHFNDPEVVVSAKRLGLPIVNLSSTPIGLPTVWFDEVAIGRTACEHLLAQGAERITYLRWSHDGPVWDDRGIGAQEVCQRRSIPFAQVKVAKPDDVIAVLAGLGPHHGLFCANDGIGLWTLRQAQAAGIPVPQRCLVVGVDDTQDICPFTRPTLSSERLNFEALLEIAFDQLERCIDGRGPDPDPPLAPPATVIIRESTATAPDSGPLALAMDYIRHHASHNPGLEDIAAAAGIHPRALQRLFRIRLDATPLAVVVSERLAHARNLLVGSDLAISGIAAACGYASQQRFAAAFRRAFGETPGRFRARMRPDSARR